MPHTATPESRMRKPLLTVVMAVYNGEHYLREAIESILNQTYPDFEFVIVNDGSTDGTKDLLDRYSRVDGRIRDHRPHQGLIPSLNRGCSLVRSPYIARMNADDVAFIDRLERQLGFMKEHPGVAIVGGASERIDTNGNVTAVSRRSNRSGEIRPTITC